MKSTHCGVLHCDTTVSFVHYMAVLNLMRVCLFSYLGGLDFVLHEIGLSLSVVGIFNLPFSFFLFPLVSMIIVNQDVV